MPFLSRTFISLGSPFLLRGAVSLLTALPLWFFPLVSSSAEGGAVLGLEESIARTLTDNPSLRAQGYAMDMQEARVLQAGIQPKPELYIEVENVLGSGRNDVFNAAQSTIGIAWILERGVREVMVEAARAGIPLVESQTSVNRLDAAAETARRYLDSLLLQTRRVNAAEGIRLAEEAMEAISARVSAGSVPAAEEARARAELARRELVLENIEHELLSAYYRLAAQWGATEPGFSRVMGDILEIPDVDSFEALQDKLGENPDIAVFLSRQRLDEANLRLQQARNRQSWRVSAGVRRMEDSGDHAFVADFSMPLGREDGNRGRVEEARAAIARTQLEAEAEQVRLATELFVIYQELQHSIHLSMALSDEILPLYEQALEETQAAYAAGRYSYLEWNAAQNDLLAARADLIEAHAGIYRNLIEIERLTGVSVEIPQF